MGAKRLFLTQIAAGAALAAAVFGMQAGAASAEVPLPQVSPYLRAAIEADIEARGYKYAGDIRFDSMYATPGDWVSSVQSVGPNEAVVTYGKFASDDIITVKFVPKGTYGWVNPATGIGSPERVAVMAGQPGTAPHSWVIEGQDFPPNTDVVLFDGTGGGGEQRVPTDHNLVTVKTDASGHFKTTVTFTSKAVPGQVNRLVQATGGAFLQLRFDQEVTGQPAPADPTPTKPDPTKPEPTKPDPSEPVPTKPAPADPTPVTPADDDNDNDDDSSGSDMVAYVAIAGLGLAAVAGGFGIVTVARRR
jgi:hypothetical protein